MTTSPVRRSGRKRQQAVSIYDEAKKAQDEQLSQEKKEQEESDKEEGSEQGSLTGEESANEEEARSGSGEEDEEDVDMEEDSEEGEEDESEEDDNDDDDDEDYGTKPSRRKTPQKSPKRNTRPKTSSTKSTPKVKQRKPNKIAVQIRPKAKTAISPLRPKTARAAGTKSIRTALQTLANKVLEPDETPEGSLVAALLQMNLVPTRGNKAVTLEDASHSPTMYTTHLHSIAQRIVAQHNVDPNGAQVQLLNLLFRSIGGSTETNLPHVPDNDDGENSDGEPKLLEDMEDEDWGIVITDLVDEMRYQAPEHVLFCTDPNGAVHMNAVESMGAGVPPTNEDGMEDGDVGASTGAESKRVYSMRDVPIMPSSLGVREYRKIYEEFWYILGHVAMAEGGMSGFVEDKLEDSDDEDDEDIYDLADDGTTMEHESVIEQRHTKRKRRAAASTSKAKKKQKNLATVTTRFDTEVVRDVLCLVIELLSVGQPDVRAAATCSALSLAHAILDKTVYVSDKLKIVHRQFTAASKSNESGAKAESLRHQMDSLQRTKTDLEEMVMEMVVKGVFAHRYRDSNMFIRAMSLEALGKMAVRRPDLFLVDQYLKYFGWMLSDKAECVRIAALEGLHRPFEVVEAAKASGRKCSIVLSTMENVTKKFLQRITDCVIDVHVSVQESAMRLMLSLLRASFLDEVEDDHMWDQVNILAFESKSSPQVRRDALYFIMEQLEEFDEGDNEGKHRGKKSMAQPSERTVAQRLDAIASWAAHNLSNGDIPMDKIKIHLVDHLVHSLRAMPEHKCIVTNWAAMIRAITDDKAAMTSNGISAGDRADLTKQRVLVQMLACATKAEVESVTNPEFLQEGLDPDEAIALTKEALAQEFSLKGVKKSVSTGLNHEALSVALIKALPAHLDKFKSDDLILESLTCLPRYFLPSVFSLPQRKPDFLSLLKTLTDIYLLSTNETVLKSTARSIIYLSEGNHARSNEAKAAIQKIVVELRSRISKHLVENSDKSDDAKDKGNRRKSLRRKKAKSIVEGLSESEDDEVEADLELRKMDNEYALFLNLQRARVLSRLCNISHYAEDEEKDSVEDLCHSVADGLVSRLEKAKIAEGNEDESDNVSKTGGWKNDEKNLSLITAGSIDEGMQLILSVTAWYLLSAQDEEGLVVDDDTAMKDNSSTDEDTNEVNDHVILRLRNRLISVVEKCFDQYLTKDEVSNEHLAAQQRWSHLVQESACEVAVDLRTLFPKEWSNAVSPLLRALAITEDGTLIGGFVRFFRTKQLDLQSTNIGQRKGDKCNDLLLSFGRSVAMNWKLGNRREAGVLLSHITGSGAQATEIVTAVSRLLKKIQPVRLLEAQMASLRQSYEDWILNDPSDKRSDIDDENPTDEMMERFEREEREHKEQFETITKQASRFSMSLGVRKLSDENTLSPALLGFIQEGIRFSFSKSQELMLGSRLSFLSILIKYAHWIKKNSEYKRVISEDLHEKEYDLKMDDDFEEVHEDDVKALFEFRAAIGLGPSPVLSSEASTVDDATSIRSGAGSVSGSVTTFHTNASTRSRATELTPNSTLTPYTHDHSKARPDTDNDGDDDASGESSTIMMHATATPASSKASRSARGSSIGSVRSMVSSVRSSLSPLYEEQGEQDQQHEHEEGSGSLEEEEGSKTYSRGNLSTPGTSSRRSAYDSSVASPNSYPNTQSTLDKDQSVASSNADSYSKSQSPSVASPDAYHRTQSTFDKDHSDLESPHAD